MKCLRSLTPVLSLATALLLATPAAAKGPFSALNPFAKKKKEVRTPYQTKAASGTNGQYSDFRTPPRPRQSALGKLNESTKNFFAKTGQALTPWNKQQADTSRYRPPAGRPYYRQATPGPKNKKSIFWIPSWFAKDEKEEKRPRTVNDFLSQPRPDF